VRGFFAGVGLAVGFAVPPVLLAVAPEPAPVVLPVPVLPTFVVPVALLFEPVVVLDCDPGLVGAVGAGGVGNEVNGFGKSGKGLLRMPATNSLRPVVVVFRSL
jgi:hypothetical protein